MQEKAEVIARGLDGELLTVAIVRLPLFRGPPSYPYQSQIWLAGTVAVDVVIAVCMTYLVRSRPTCPCLLHS